MNARKQLLVGVLIALFVAAPVALAAALAGRAKYVGKTSDDNAVTLKLNGDGSRIKRMRIHYSVTCNDGRTGDTYTDVLGPRVRKDHTFSAKGTYTGSGDGSENAFKVSGKVWANTASGKFSLTATGKAGDGTTLRCKTAKLTWSAKRQK